MSYIDKAICELKRKQLEWRQEQWAMTVTGGVLFLAMAVVVFVLSDCPWWLGPAIIGVGAAITSMCWGLFLVFRAIARKVIR